MSVSVPQKKAGGLRGQAPAFSCANACAREPQTLPRRAGD
jgi:hypothetical protein